jgi:eukaryotic-like serine/threonine-protein kinase
MLALVATKPPLLPVLVADLDADEARELLLGVALAGGKVSVPLLAAPVDATTHVLEVHTPGAREPLVFLADPVGAPTAAGFPLRLRPVATDNAPSRPPPESGERVSEPPALRSRRSAEISLSPRHSRILEGGAAAVSPEALVGRAMANGKLRIESVIGQGGVGVVYRAIHRDLRIPVAVKVLHDSFQHDIEFCRRFHIEALSASRLDHPNVVRILDFGQEPEGLLYIAMEYLDGTPLSRRVEPGRGLALPSIVDIMAQVCAALSHAHQRGIVHRDVKPDNVVLVAARDDDERPIERAKVCDFGIAVQSADEAGPRLVAGTPQYMSPEQCRGEPLDGRSDVYGCGVMLYELATGQPPFVGDDAAAIIDRHVNVQPLAPRLVNPAVDPALEAIVLKALAKDPAKRHGSMRELRAELRGLLAQRPEWSDEAPSSPAVLAHGTERRRAAIGAAFASAGEPGSVEVPVEIEVDLGPATPPWLLRFSEARRREDLEPMFAELETALPALVTGGQVAAVAAIYETLAAFTADGLPGGEWRAARAASLMRLFGDPAFLAWVAELALAGDGDARRLLVAIGTPAAYALYSARLKATSRPVRERFVAMVRELGSSALPMVRAGLTRLEPHRETAIAAQMAIDLLRGVPDVTDDAAGEIVARYARSGLPLLVGASVPALTRLWADRARPVLVALLTSEDERVRVAAVQSLETLRGLDEVVMRRIAPAAPSPPAPETGDLRLAVEEAFQAAQAALGADVQVDPNEPPGA